MPTQSRIKIVMRFAPVSCRVPLTIQVYNTFGDCQIKWEDFPESAIVYKIPVPLALIVRLTPGIYYYSGVFPRNPADSQSIRPPRIPSCPYNRHNSPSHHNRDNPDCHHKAGYVQSASLATPADRPPYRKLDASDSTRDGRSEPEATRQLADHLAKPEHPHNRYHYHNG